MSLSGISGSERGIVFRGLLFFIPFPLFSLFSLFLQFLRQKRKEKFERTQFGHFWWCSPGERREEAYLKKVVPWFLARPMG